MSAAIVEVRSVAPQPNVLQSGLFEIPERDFSLFREGQAQGRQEYSQP